MNSQDGYNRLSVHISSTPTYPSGQSICPSHLQATGMQSLLLGVKAEHVKRSLPQSGSAEQLLLSSWSTKPCEQAQTAFVPFTMQRWLHRLACTCPHEWLALGCLTETRSRIWEACVRTTERELPVLSSRRCSCWISRSSQYSQLEWMVSWVMRELLSFKTTCLKKIA